MNKKLLFSLVLVVIGLGSFSLVNSQQTSNPTYYGQVEQIIATNCLGCHVAGGIAPFSLEKPEVVQRLARGIKYSVENNSMPPWLPGPESPAMQDERKLLPEDKATLLAWIAAGVPWRSEPANATASTARAAQASAGSGPQHGHSL